MKFYISGYILNPRLISVSLWIVRKYIIYFSCTDYECSCFQFYIKSLLFTFIPISTFKYDEVNKPYLFRMHANTCLTIRICFGSFSKNECHLVKYLRLYKRVCMFCLYINKILHLLYCINHMKRFFEVHKFLAKICEIYFKRKIQVNLL